MIRYQEHDTFPLYCLDTRIIDISEDLEPGWGQTILFPFLPPSPECELENWSSSFLSYTCQLSGDVFVWRYCVLCLHYALVAQFVSPVPALQQQHDVSSKNYSQIYYFENSRDKSKVSDWMRWQDVSINSIWVSLWKGRSWIARQRFASGLTEHWEFYYLSSDIFF